MFLGRQWELSQLNALWQSDKFQMFILYGRRRVGKTALIREFCKDKPSIFFSAGQSNERMNLEKFSQLVYQHYGEENGSSFVSMEKALSYINERQQLEPLVVVIDEFPYLAAGNSSLLSDLQHIIDFQLSTGKIFLILCGSYMGFMEKEVLGVKSPLFGRRTAQLKLKPMDYADSTLFLEGFSQHEKLLLYGIFGGTPLYLSQIDNSKSIEDNVKRLFLNPMGYLYEEANMLLRQEVKELAVYSSVIEAIANGASKANDISMKTGEESAKCLKYIRVLEELGLVSREVPLLDKPTSRKTIYHIEDLMFVFWYRYVARYRSQLENGAEEIIWSRRVEPDLNHYMGQAFERICHEYVIRKNAAGELPIMFYQLGRWWGINSTSIQHEQIEIDMVAVDGNDYIFGECKWRNELLDIGVVNTLKERAEIMQPKRGETWYMFFSKSGFTDAVRELAVADKHIILVGIDDLMNVKSRGDS